MGDLNVDRGELKRCAARTGFTRSGYCKPDPGDGGNHLICATMTQDFLDYTKAKGNDLSSVVGVGENWCLCTGRYSEAADKAPPVVREATHISAASQIRALSRVGELENARASSSAATLRR